MASGSFNVSTNNQYISGHVDWSSTPNTSGNYSTVTATLYLSRTNTGYTTSGTGTFYITIEGNQGANTQSFSFTYNSNTQCVSHTVNVNHNSDGTKTTVISVWGSMPTFSMSTQSANATLDTIPRASTCTTSANNIDMGTQITIYTNRASSSFTHNLTFNWGSSHISIANGVADNVNWTPPVDLANQIPNATGGWGGIQCDTYSGGTLIGTTYTRLDLTVPSWVVPSISSMSNWELNTNVYNITGTYVQKLSNIRLTINGANGSYSSTISSYQITYNGTNYGSSSIDTGTINWNGNLTVTGIVTDSRGRTANKSITLSALPYNVPNISAFYVARCNSDGSSNDMGEYAGISTAGSVSSLYNGSEKNSLTYTLYSKPRNSSNWSIARASETISGLNLNINNVLGTYTATSSYDFRLDIADKFNTTISLTVLPTGQVALSWAKNGVGIGKVWEQGALDVGGDTYIGGTLYPINGIRFDSTTNAGSDYGYIHYDSDNNAYAYWGDSNENSALVIEVQNDGQNISSDVVVLKSPAGVIADTPELIIGSRATASMYYVKSNYGSNYWTDGNGDGCSWSTYNTNLHVHWGLGITDYNGNCGILFDSRAGTIYLKGQIGIEGSTYPHIYGDGNVLQLSWMNDSTSGVVSDGRTGAFRSAGDTVTPLGYSTHRWSDIYASSNVINTSDRNEKNTITPLDDTLTENFIMGLAPVSFKYNYGTSGRLHYGMIAQDVETLMNSLNMTSLDFAGFIKTPIYDDNGNIIEEHYGLRYEEFISPLIKVAQLQKQQIIDLTSRITTLEGKVA